MSVYNASLYNVLVFFATKRLVPGMSYLFCFVPEKNPKRIDVNYLKMFGGKYVPSSLH